MKRANRLIGRRKSFGKKSFISRIRYFSAIPGFCFRTPKDAAAGINIRRFQDDYALYETYEDKEGHDLWRIFGKLYDGNPETLPENTSLQKAYKKWLLEGRVPGAGRGFWVKKKSACRLLRLRRVALATFFLSAVV